MLWQFLLYCPLLYLEVMFNITPCIVGIIMDTLVLPLSSITTYVGVTITLHILDS